MHYSILLTVFVTVFLAELGDKTQLATMLFASDAQNNPWMIFLAASLALVASSALAVLLGSYISHYSDIIPIKLIAGIGFILIGAWIVFEHFKHATI